jgi:hypothetical protein
MNAADEGSAPLRNFKRAELAGNLNLFRAKVEALTRPANGFSAIATLVDE